MANLLVSSVRTMTPAAGRFPRGYARRMAKDISQAVREVCLWLPESSEVISHGSPDFRVRGKTFATYVINHHGDGRVALWLNAPAGAQELYTKEEPKHFFVPPYVGARGWLRGVV